MKKISPVFLVLFTVAIVAVIILSVLYFQERKAQQAVITSPVEATGIFGATKMLGSDILTGAVEGIGKSFSNLTSIFGGK